MEIRKEKNGNALILHLSGKLAIKEAQVLDQVVRSELSGITDLTLDMTEVPYISSAGLRVLIIAQNMMDEAGGTLTIPCERNGGQRPEIDRVQRFHED